MSGTSADYNTSLGISAATSISGKYVTSVLSKIMVAQAGTRGQGHDHRHLQFRHSGSVWRMLTMVGTCTSGVGMKWDVVPVRLRLSLLVQRNGADCGGLAYPAKFLPRSNQG